MASLANTLSLFAKHVVHAVDEGPVMELPGHRKQLALANCPASALLSIPSLHRYVMAIEGNSRDPSEKNPIPGR